MLSAVGDHQGYCATDAGDRGQRRLEYIDPRGRCTGVGVKCMCDRDIANAHQQQAEGDGADDSGEQGRLPCAPQSARCVGAQASNGHHQACSRAGCYERQPDSAPGNPAGSQPAPHNVADLGGCLPAEEPPGQHSSGCSRNHSTRDVHAFGVVAHPEERCILILVLRRHRDIEAVSWCLRG